MFMIKYSEPNFISNQLAVQFVRPFITRRLAMKSKTRNAGDALKSRRRYERVALQHLRAGQAL